jgi:hypothetical protein
MSHSITGTVKLIDQTQTFASGFQKREFVITTAEQYPQEVKFEVVKEKCSELDHYTVGRSLMVHFNIRGNEYNGKYYVSLQAWKLEGAKAAPAPVAAPVAAPPAEDNEPPF